ncbi:MAG: hypothetical protein ACJ763_17845 [Bdellovibrionia bacterium]
MLMPLLFWTFLLLSMIGWGRCIAEHFVKEREQKVIWPLQVIWGLALTCCFGSFYLAIVPGSPRMAWWIWLFAGTANCAVSYLRVRKNPDYSDCEKLNPFFRAFQITFILIMFASAALMCLKSMAVRSFNCYDDFLAYVPEVRMILDRGNFSSPFSLRRLAAYGGQSILQSFFVLPLKEYYLWGFERAFMLLLGTAFIFEWIRQKSARIIAACLLCTIFLWAEHPYINIASELSGTVLVFGILATAKLYEACDSSLKSRYAILLGVLACALSQCRASDFAAALLFLSIPFIYKIFLKRDASLGYAILTLVAGVLPGAWMLYHSSGTPFFPIIQGNYDPSYGTFDTPDNIEIFRYLKLTAEAAQLNMMLVLACAAFFHLRNRLWLFSGLITAFSILGALAFNLRATYDHQSVYRYAYPLFSGTAFFIFAELMASDLDWSWPKKAKEWAYRVSAGLSFVMLLVLVVDIRFSIHQFFLIDSETILQTIHQGVTDPFKELRGRYADLQSAIPQDGRVALAVEHPFLFDFAKTQFTLLDVPGCASPGHGFKTSLTPKKIDDYFRMQGIQYLVFEDPDQSSCQYSRHFWNSYKSVPGVKDFHKYWYPHHLEFFEYLDWKKAHDLVVAKGRYYVVKID